MFANPHEILDGFESLRRHHLAKKSLRETQLTRIALKKGAKVLDIGIGPGLYLAFWLQHSANSQAHFTLFENNPKALELCLKEAETVGAKDRVTPVVGDLFNLAASSLGKFDVIFIGNTLEYVKDPSAYLRDQVIPLLSPGGQLVVRDLDCGYVNCNLMDPALNHKVVGARIRNCQETKSYHNPFIGRDLGRIMKEAGLSSVSLTADLEEFRGPLSNEQAAYLGKLHTTWYVEDVLGILSPDDIANWSEAFSPDNPENVLHHPDFYYTEMEYFAVGTKISPERSEL